MRIHVSFIDRVGITQEVLALLGARNLNLDAVEAGTSTSTPRPSARRARSCTTRSVRGARRAVGGRGRHPPGQRRHLQLDALLAAMTDPVLAVDSAGNAAGQPGADRLCGREPAGRSLAELFGDPDCCQALLDNFRLPMREMQLNGQTCCSTPRRSPTPAGC
jgi:transcriptional regulator of aromatic amino acid metabolism